MIDAATGYFHNPPPYHFLQLDGLRSIFQQQDKVQKMLSLLQVYCQKMAADGIAPMGIVLGGDYVHASEDKTGKIKILICFEVGAKVTRQAILDYCTAGGSIAKDFAPAFVPSGPIYLANFAANDLNGDVKVREMRRDHKLKNKFKDVGLVCLNFGEVVK